MTEANDVEVLPRPRALVIAQVPIELPPGASVIEIKLRESAIVRGVGFWLHEPKVVASAMRGVQKILMPLLWVECDPRGAIDEVARVFAFVPSDAPFEPKPGWEARYVATAIGERGAMHLLELVEVASTPLVNIPASDLMPAGEALPADKCPCCAGCGALVFPDRFGSGRMACDACGGTGRVPS